MSHVANLAQKSHQANLELTNTTHQLQPFSPLIRDADHLPNHVYVVPLMTVDNSSDFVTKMFSYAWRRGRRCA